MLWLVTKAHCRSFIMCDCINLQARKISLGLCLPSTCGGPEDAAGLVSLSLVATAPRDGFRDIEVKKVRVVPGDYAFFRDPGFILLVGSGRFLFGNNWWLGSRVQCLEADKEFASDNSSVRSVYRVITLSVNLSTPLTPQARKISLGLCLPSTCGGPEDAAGLVSLSLVATAPRDGFRDIEVKKVRVVPGDYAFFTDPGFILLVAVFALFTIVTIAGTTLDMVTTQRTKSVECNGNHLSYTAEGPKSCAPTVQQDVPPTGWTWGEVLLAFSIRLNVRRFFSGLQPGQGSSQGHEDGSLSTVHGLRVFSLVWVIACHTCLYAFAFSDNRLFRAAVEKDFLFQSISNGNFSVDTFFFVSGLLLSYVFLRGLKRGARTEVMTSKESASKFLGYCLYRFVRLTPPYAFVIALVSVTMQWYASVSVFDPPTWDHATCPNYWWRNLLYINTVFPVTQMCMIWSWYLAADTQFYLAGIILLLVFLRHPRVAVGLGLALLLASWTTTAAISYTLDHTPSIEKPFEMFDVLYDKPWTRFGPYLVGMATGWLLARTGGNVKFTKIGVCVGWTLCMSTSFGLVHALYGRLLGPLASAAYVALSHTLWAITWAFFNMDSPLTLSRDLV
ncbi:hypothetical protein B566_EDAN015380, partial [Ephemera danica]